MILPIIEPAPLVLGIDLVAVSRIQQLYQQWGARFLNRFYTPAEQAYCVVTSPATTAQRLSSHFAAKEAVIKALNKPRCRWVDIEVKHGPQGQPHLQLFGAAQNVAQQSGIQKWLISLTHSHDMAMAAVIGR